MAELTSIGFRTGTSVLHRLDPRTKQILLMVFGLAALFGDERFLLLASALVALLLRKAGLRVSVIVRETRYFLYLLIFVFAVRAISFTDQFYPVISPEGLSEALFFCWRLLLIVLMGLLLVSTTRTSDIRAAIIWFLKPLPLVDEKMAATMVGLLVRFLPLILFQAREIDEGMRARGIERRRNPLVRPVRFSVALFRRVFVRADELVETMQARCYSEQRTLPQLRFSAADGWAAGFGLLALLTAFLP
jgi:energy-coupling factor transporter transmembrane protein EcfT